MRNAIRTGRIEIDVLKRNGPTWISSNIQTLEIDDAGNILSERMRDRKLYRKVDDVALEMATATDPVTGKTVTVSIAGVGALVKAAMIQWMLEDNAAHYDSSIDLVVLNGPVI